MIGLYLDPFIIENNFCSMISILNELSLQKGIARNDGKAFWTKSKNTTTRKQKKQTYKSLLVPQIEPGTSCSLVWGVTSRPPSHLYIPIKVKLFNYFNPTGRIKNKHSHICGPHFFIKYINVYKLYEKVRGKHFWSKDICIESLRQSFISNWHILFRTKLYLG